MPRIEWQTCMLVLAVYALWAMAAASRGILPPSLAMPASCALLALASCWYMSLQHELIHGHPTRSKAFNRWLGLAPLAVWYPYDIYRRGHLAHHRNELLTQPGIDPESNYIDADDYDNLPAWARPLWVAQRTAVGRLLLGPAFVILPTWLDIVRKPLKGDFSETRTWALHLVLLGSMLWALQQYAGVPAWQYMLFVGYPALGLAMLRSFHEHRPSLLPAHRVVINEAGAAWRLLFLNNNYHSVHHEDSSMPWYRIRKAYLADREGYLYRNGGFLVIGYCTLFKHFGLKPIDSPVHPPTHSSARLPIHETAST